MHCDVSARFVKRKAFTFSDPPSTRIPLPLPSSPHLPSHPSSPCSRVPAFLLALETRNRQLARHCGATRLFSEKRTTAAAAAAAAVNGNKGGGGGGNVLMQWKPEPDRYLLLSCHKGKLSERLVCLQHHLLLAGLLNRTLLIGRFHSKGVRGEHSWELAVDVGHLRMCYGEDTVLLAHEWRARERGKGTGRGGEGEGEGRRRVLVGRGDAGWGVRGGEVEGEERWKEEAEEEGEEEDGEEHERGEARHGDEETRGEEAETVQWRRFLKGKKKQKKETEKKSKEDEENSSAEEAFDPEETAHPIAIDALVPWYKDKSALPKRFRARPDLSFPRPALFANLTRRSPLRSFLSVYTAPEVRAARVLFVGDLLYAFWEVPDAPNLVNFPGDAPFVRSPGCPNPYTLLPNRKVLRLAKEIQKTFFSGSDGAKVPFLAVNYEKRAGLEGQLWCDLGGDAEAAAARAAAADKESKSKIGFVKKGKRRGLRSIEESVGNRACQLSVAEVAGCLWRKLSASGIRRLFLVTDASDQEVREAWYKLWEINGDSVRFILPRAFHQRILKRFPGTFQQVLDLVTMAISAQADMFQGSFGSLFSLQTMRLRYAFSTASCRDAALGDDFLLPVDTTADAGWGVFLDLQDNGL
ncbi:unnamed protein product [Closterium sp. Yama58-4]|nr:unnamed protein product [Closterium sp. Yama58-4]